MMAGGDWVDAKDVLCIRLDTIGDVLMTTPALRALRESVPGRRITVLTSAGGAEVARMVPEVDRVLVYEAPWVKATSPDGARADDEMIRRLRALRFDSAVIFTVYSQNPLPAAFLCRLAGIPRVLAHCRENPYLLLSDWIPEREPERLTRHEVKRQLDLVAEIGARTRDRRLSLRVPPRAERAAGSLLDGLSLDTVRPWAVIHPGATAPSRRYGAEGFAAAARALVSDHGWQLLFTGGRDEVELVDAIREAALVPTHSLAGRLALPELAAVLSRAPLLIANNTGPVHVAAAVGTPVVDLYALTNPQHTPWGVPSAVLSHDVPCRWCYSSVCPEGHHNCLRLVQPNDVVAAALRLFREHGPLGRIGGTEEVHVAKPQQPELARSRRGQVDQEEWKRKEEASGPPGDRGKTGPIPEENRPGHHPDQEQDRPDEEEQTSS